MSLHIFICEDDPIHLKSIENIVNHYIDTGSRNITLSFATHNPDFLLNYLKDCSFQHSLYILDVDLQHEWNGIALASKIREYDSLGEIVFVTSHAEFSHLTFQYHLKALDYIIKDKDDLTEKIGRCIELAYRHHENSPFKKEFFQINSGGTIRNVPLEEILFFETHPSAHRLVLHLENGRIEFRGSLREVEDAHRTLFRCHMAYVVNTKKVTSIDRINRTIEVTSGERLLVSRSKMKKLLSIIEP